MLSFGSLLAARLVLAQWSSLAAGDKPGRKASPQAKCGILLPPRAGAGVGRCFKEWLHGALADFWSVCLSPCFLFQRITVQAMTR